MPRIPSSLCPLLSIFSFIIFPGLFLSADLLSSNHVVSTSYTHFNFRKKHSPAIPASSGTKGNETAAPTEAVKKKMFVFFFFLFFCLFVWFGFFVWFISHFEMNIFLVNAMIEQMYWDNLKHTTYKLIINLFLSQIQGTEKFGDDVFHKYSLVSKFQ